MYKVYSYKKKRNKGLILIALSIVLVAFGGYYTFKSILTKEIKQEAESKPITKINEETLPTKTNANNQFKYQENALFNVTYYYTCGHKKVEEKKIPLGFIGKTLEELTADNPGYEFYDCTPEIIRANVIMDTQCDDHYIIKLSGDKLYVYYKKNPEMIEREVEINISDLYDEDIEILKNGIEVGSKTELLEFLEDFAS